MGRVRAPDSGLAVGYRCRRVAEDRRGSRDPSSLVVRAAVFLSVSVLWLPVRPRGDRGSGRPYPGSSSIAAAEVALKTITLPRSG